MASLEGRDRCRGHGQRPGGGVPHVRRALRRRRPHRGFGRAVRRHLHPARRDLRRFGDRRRRSWPRTTPTTSPPRSGPRPSWCTPRSSATRPGRSPTSTALADVAHAHGLPLVDRRHVRHALPVPARSSTAPTSSCTRPPSSSAGTAPRSAASSSSRAGSTWDNGRFPHMTEPVAVVRRAARCGSNFGEYALLHQAARRAAPRRRRLPVAVQRLPAPAGPRDAAAAHGRPRRQRAAVAALPRATIRTCRGCATPGLPGVAVPRAGPSATCRTGPGRSSRSGWRAAGRPGRASSSGASWCSHLANVGDAKTPRDPPGLDHAPAAPRRRARGRPGSAPDMVRLSVGIEDADDIIWRPRPGAGRGGPAMTTPARTPGLPARRRRVARRGHAGPPGPWSPPRPGAPGDPRRARIDGHRRRVGEPGPSSYFVATYLLSSSS